MTSSSDSAKEDASRRRMNKGRREANSSSGSDGHDDGGIEISVI